MFRNARKICLFLLFFLSFCFGQYNELSPVTSSNLPFNGTLTLEEFDWPTEERYGIIEVQLPTGKKTHLLDGIYGHRHRNGQIVFAQGCGSLVNRLAIRDTQGLITYASPCSSKLSNPSGYYLEPSFGFSRLSPDAQKVAAELLYNIDTLDYGYSTLVFDVQGNQLAFFENFYAPLWLPDGRLLLTGEGFYLTDSELKNPTRIDGGKLNAWIISPDLDPSGTRLAFEYNQQIWFMNIDGSSLQEAITAPKILKYPTWSTDGSSLAYMAGVSQTQLDEAIYFTDLTTGTHYTLNLEAVLHDFGGAPNGPLSWVK